MATRPAPQLPAPTSRIEGLATLIQKAREDAAFFHKLIWDTEAVVAGLDYLSREEKASLVGINPEDLVAGLATGNIGVRTEVAACGATCAGSCGGSCGVTCSASCAGSCGVSCATTGAMQRADDLVVNPAYQLADQIQTMLDGQAFSRYRR